MENGQNEERKATIIAISLIAVVIMSVILAIIFFISSDKTENKGKKNIVGGQTINENYYEPTEEEKTRAAELTNILKGSLPQIDGIVDTIPLEAGISVKLFGKTQEIVEAGITHTDAEKAYSNLISGKADVIFTRSFTEKQEREAAAKNIDIKKETIAYDGIVFVVNANNPVDTLSQEQIKGIYSGEIKNWSEVGGNDVEIIAFQNKAEDTAQIFMENFMAGESLMEPAKEFLPMENSEIAEKTATYDNSENAIGYMIYKYPADMYEGNEKIKFIKIDGIEATKKNMLSKEYPLRSDVYAIYNNNKATTKTSDELVEWLLTYEGQIAIASSGYIPIKNVRVTENKVDKYSSLGTGKEQADLESFYYTVIPQSYNVVGQDALVVGIQGLKNQDMQRNINSFIRESIENLQGKESEYEKYVILKPNCAKEGITVETECKNGYLSIQAVLTYRVGQYQYIYDGYSKVYDLYTGEELELSDLYYKDTEFVSILNEQIETIIVEKTGINDTYLRMKRPFMGITDKVLYGFDSISFTKENPYFEESVEFKLDTYFDNISVINEERDMEDIWEDNIVVSKSVIMHEGDETTLQRGKIAMKETGNCVYNLFYSKTNNLEVDEAINENIDKYAKDDSIRPLLQKAVNSGANLTLTQNSKYQITINVTVYGDKYAIMNITVNPKQNKVSLGTATMNLETGEKATKEEIQKWQEDNGA